MRVLLNSILLDGEKVQCNQCKATINPGKKTMLTVELKDGAFKHVGHICGNCMAQFPQGEQIPATMLGSPVVAPSVRKG